MTKVVDILLSDPIIIASIPNCGLGYNLNFGFSTASCINFCIVSEGSQMTPIGELIKVKYVKLPCDGKACCKTTYQVCKLPDGSLNTTVSISAGTGNCSNQAPTLPCPMNTIGSTGCIPNCYLL